jgi:hypothetical protein
LAQSARENQPGCRIGFPGLAIAIYTDGPWSIPYSALSRMDHRLQCKRGNTTMCATVITGADATDAEMWCSLDCVASFWLRPIGCSAVVSLDRNLTP